MTTHKQATLLMHTFAAARMSGVSREDVEVERLHLPLSSNTLNDFKAPWELEWEDGRQRNY